MIINKNILVPNINITLASIAISEEKQKSSTVLVLAELISRSQDSLIEFPRDLQYEISHKLKISPEEYRRQIAILKKMNLIRKTENNHFILNPILKTPFDIITIKQNEENIQS